MSQLSLLSLYYDGQTTLHQTFGVMPLLAVLKKGTSNISCTWFPLWRKACPDPKGSDSRFHDLAVYGNVRQIAPEGLACYFGLYL